MLFNDVIYASSKMTWWSRKVCR